MPAATAFIRLRKQIAQAIEAALPFGAAIGDPLHGCGKPCGFDAVRTLPIFSRLHQAAFLQHLQVLNDRGQRSERIGRARDRDGAWLSFSNKARRVGSPKAWKTRSISGSSFACTVLFQRTPRSALDFRRQSVQ